MKLFKVIKQILYSKYYVSFEEGINHPVSLRQNEADFFLDLFFTFTLEFLEVAV